MVNLTSETILHCDSWVGIKCHLWSVLVAIDGVECFKKGLPPKAFLPFVVLQKSISMIYAGFLIIPISMEKWVPLADYAN